MINLVLSTDMSKHFSELGKFKARISSTEFDFSNLSDKDMVLQTMFHLADISNPTKPWNLC
jgi:3'5'-cyclic nucleotide phosphodiesterase